MLHSSLEYSPTGSHCVRELIPGYRDINCMTMRYIRAKRSRSNSAIAGKISLSTLDDKAALVRCRNKMINACND